MSPLSRSIPRCRDTPDWAMPRIPVNSVTFRRSAVSRRSMRRRTSSPSSRNSAAVSVTLLIYICVFVYVNWRWRPCPVLEHCPLFGDSPQSLGPLPVRHPVLDGFLDVVTGEVFADGALDKGR